MSGFNEIEKLIGEATEYDKKQAVLWMRWIILSTREVSSLF